MRVEPKREAAEAFGSYLLLRPLGKGGMGVVYVARTRIADHPLAALKRLRPDCVSVPGFAERFWHEGALALRLAHPHVVETLDVGNVDSQPYVASAFILGKDGHAVADQLARRGLGAPAAVAVRLLLDVLAALAYLHEARESDGRPLRLIHRDITPGNLLIGYDGKVRVADFGLAKSLLTEELKLTADGMILGTPRYMAPELIRGQRPTPAADLYGLGAVIYRVLTGTAPYEGTPKEVVEQVLRERPRPLGALRPDLPRWLCGVVERLMEHDLSLRPGSARLLGLEVEEEARARKQLVEHADLASWMRELFLEEHKKELAEAEELKRIGESAVPVAEHGTRVLKRTARILPTLELGPTFASYGGEERTVVSDAEPPPAELSVLVEDEHTDRRPSPVPEGFSLGDGPTGSGPLARTRSEAPAEAARTLTDGDLDARALPLEPRVAAPHSGPPLSAPPAPIAARRYLALSLGMLLALLAGGLIGGLVLTDQKDRERDERRWTLGERLGSARQRLQGQRARATGGRWAEADRLVHGVRTAIAEDRLTEAQLGLQELELLLDASTTTGAAGLGGR